MLKALYFAELAELLDVEDQMARALPLAFLPPAAPEEGREPGLSDDAPDWLLSGSWTAVTHERAERLPEEARAYVNEFDPTSAAQGGERPERERMIARESGENEGEPKPDR